MSLRVRSILLLSFAVLVGLFGLATIVTVRSISRVQALHERLAQLDHAKHEGHLMLADVLELYVHQAHTLIASGLSHLPHYQESLEACLDRLASLKSATAVVELHGSIDELERCVAEMDDYFQRGPLKEIREGKALRGSEHSAHLELLTAGAQDQIQELNTQLALSSNRVQAELNALLSRARFWTALLLSVAVIVAALIGLALVRTISRPLIRLDQAFGQVGAGLLDTRISPSGPHEIRNLGESFNAMVHTLAENRRLIAEKERMAVMGEVAAGVAHELNNPLGVITGYVKVLSRQSEDPRTQSDLAIISDEVQQCQLIVQGLLQLARPPALHIHDVSITNLVTEVIERLAMVPSRPTVDLSLESPAHVEAAVDEFALRGVLVNLVTNAQDAAGDGGRVCVSVAADGTGLLLAVDDSGPGIGPEEEALVFRPFYTTRSKGIGLGLAIAHALVRAHGGSIAVTSSDLGGARFEIRIPTQRAPEESPV